MNYRTSILPNNLRVVTAEIPDAYSATVSVGVGVGSRYEKFGANDGISHFIEHLLFKGTATRPTTQIISEQVDAVGGWMNAYTSNDSTIYYTRLPYQHVEIGVDIIADMIQNSLFDAEEVDRERNVVLEEMNVYRDNPARHVHRLAPKLLWPGHPLAHDVIGSDEIIKKVTRQQIVDYQKSHYKPGNMVLSVAGRIKHDQIVKLAEKYYGKMVDAPTEKIKKVGPEISKELAMTVEKDTAQTHLTISTRAYPYNHKKGPAASLVTAILGRGLSSRLFMNVRERKGLAYTVNAATDTFVDTGEFGVYAGVNTAKTPEAIEAIIEELVKIATEPVGQEELSKSQNQLIGSLQMSMESNTHVADVAARRMVLLNEIKTVEEKIAELEAVTVDDIQQVASEMLALKNLRLGLISSEIEAPVKKFTELVKV